MSPSELAPPAEHCEAPTFTARPSATSPSLHERAVGPTESERYAMEQDPVSDEELRYGFAFKYGEV